MCIRDSTDTPHEQTAGARMKKYEVDPTATKDGKLMENDIVLFRYADALLMKSEAKVRNGASGDEELNEVRSLSLIHISNLRPGVQIPPGSNGGTADVNMSVSMFPELTAVITPRMIFVKSWNMPVSIISR